MSATHESHSMQGKLYNYKVVISSPTCVSFYIDYYNPLTLNQQEIHGSIRLTFGPHYNHNRCWGRNEVYLRKPKGGGVVTNKAVEKVAKDVEETWEKYRTEDLLKKSAKRYIQHLRNSHSQEIETARERIDELEKINNDLSNKLNEIDKVKNVVEWFQSQADSLHER